MLMYFNRGLRNFAKRPDDVALRHNWEFFAVISGKVAPYFGDGEKEPLAEATLWLMPPQVRYTWYSDSKSAERVVFHFSRIDESLHILMEQRRFLSISLDQEKLARLIDITDQVQPWYEQVDIISSLYFDKALAELSILIATEHVNPDKIVTLTTKNQIKARRALAFFKSQLPRRPLVEEVAEVAGVSTTHLRRIFIEVFNCPPKHLFIISQIEHAKELAANSDMLISDIARRSGFCGATDFCRAFQKHHQTTFHRWRMQLSDQKRRPHLRASSLLPMP